MDFAGQVSQLSNNPQAQGLIDHLRNISERVALEESVVYHKFPVFRDNEERRYQPDILVSSPNHGIFVISLAPSLESLIDSGTLSEADENLVQVHSIISGILIKSRILRSGLLQLIPAISVIIFAPSASGKNQTLLTTSLICTNYNELESVIRDNQLNVPLDRSQWSELRASLEGSKGLSKPKERHLPEGNPNAPAAILRALDDEVNNFDIEQSRAVSSIVIGPQRIRGLAGSGKTVILAFKAALLHLQDPSLDILFTFYTKSLYDVVKRLISRFYRHFAGSEPNWERLSVLHGWGGYKIPGVYQSACCDADIKPMTFDVARTGSGNPFAYACKDLVDTGRVKQKYDYVLIDEAQDFPPPFFRLCFELAHGDELDRSIVWAYDDLQNIFNVEIASPAKLFGSTSDGRPLIDLERAARHSNGLASHDIVLHKCYRNPREILIVAHALGFGLYSSTIVQMLEDREHWEDIGYQFIKGDATVGSEVSILRVRENSPLSISSKINKHEMVKAQAFPKIDEEVSWIFNDLLQFLDGGLRPEDIMIICLDDRYSKSYFNRLSELLSDRSIGVNNVLNSPYSDTQFVRDNEVTLSSVYRAKGNESAVVYAAGIDAVYPLRDRRIGRNRLFTAFTRAKAWLRVTGISPSADGFMEELAKALENSPNLLFTYPDPGQVETLQRDLSDRFAKISRFVKDFTDLGINENEIFEYLQSRGHNAK